MSTHNLWGFSYNKIRKIMYTTVNTSFTKKKWDFRGSELYKHVFVMYVNVALLIRITSFNDYTQNTIIL